MRKISLFLALTAMVVGVAIAGPAPPDLREMDLIYIETTGPPTSSLLIGIPSVLPSAAGATAPFGFYYDGSTPADYHAVFFLSSATEDQDDSRNTMVPVVVAGSTTNPPSRNDAAANDALLGIRHNYVAPDAMEVDHVMKNITLAITSEGAGGGVHIPDMITSGA